MSSLEGEEINNQLSEKMPQNKVTLNEVTLNEVTIHKKKKRTYSEIMSELLKPPPKEDKPNIHLSGGGQFSKLEKI